MFLSECVSLCVSVCLCVCVCVIFTRPLVLNWDKELPALRCNEAHVGLTGIAFSLLVLGRDGIHMVM